MATVKAAIYKILQDDAKIGSVGHLGNLLGHTGTTPYGIFFRNPPKTPDFPLITYYISGESGRSPFPRDMFMDITAWGGDYDAVQNIIHDLLNDAAIVTTGVLTLMLKWIWAGPDLFDDNYKIYTRRHRFKIRGVTE